MDKIAVLIPCYNEAPTIAKVVGDFRRVLPECTVYVYDNNSTDGTAELAREGFSLIAVLPDRPGSAAEIAETLKTLEAAGLDHTGTSRSPEEQERVMVRYAGGIRVGFVAASACGAPADAPFAVNGLSDLPRLIAQTRAAGAEYVVALIPGGSPEAAAELHVLGTDLTVSADGPGLTAVLTRQADALTSEIF